MRALILVTMLLSGCGLEVCMPWLDDPVCWPLVEARARKVECLGSEPGDPCATPDGDDATCEPWPRQERWTHLVCAD